MTARDDVPADRRDFLLQAYAAYNAQDVEGPLALVSDDVDWPDDGRTAVHISQVVRSLDGSVISRCHVLHEHSIEDDLISRIDIETVSER